MSAGALPLLAPSWPEVTMAKNTGKSRNRISFTSSAPSCAHHFVPLVILLLHRPVMLLQFTYKSIRRSWPARVSVTRWLSLQDKTAGSMCDGLKDTCRDDGGKQ